MQKITSKPTALNLGSLRSVFNSLRFLVTTLQKRRENYITPIPNAGRKWVWQPIVALFFLLFATPALQAQADFVTNPVTIAPVDVGNPLTVVIRVDIISGVVDGAQANINFDNSLLEVTALNYLATSELPVPIGASALTFDNSAGTIDVSYGTFAPVAQDFDFFEIVFNTLDTGNTNLVFNTVFPRQTDITGVGSGLGTAADIPLTINSSNVDPVASFTANPTSGEVALFVQVDASTSDDPDGDNSLMTYEWDFGDGPGSTDTGVTASYTYTSVGDYTIMLTVTDEDGGTDIATQLISVTDPVIITYNITTNPGPNGTITPLSATVNEGDSQNFDIIPDPGFQVEDVLVDGVSVGAVPSYNFVNVQDDAEISASFSPIQICVVSGSAALNAFGRNFLGDPNTTPPTVPEFTRTAGKVFAGYGGAIAGTAPGSPEELLFQKEIYGGAGGGNPSFSYDVPVPNGFYQVELYFAEVFHGTAGGRVFDVFLEGNLMLDEYDLVDPIKDGVGLQTAITRTYFIEVNDGNVNIGIGPATVDNGKISGFCITGVANANLHPIANIGDLSFEALVADAQTLNISDNENDTFNITLNGLPTSLTYNAGTNQIEGSPLLAEVGDHTINAIIDDGTSSPITEEFTLTIDPSSSNGPPVIVASDVEAPAGPALDVNFQVNDEDYPNLTTTVVVYDKSVTGANTDPWTSGGTVAGFGLGDDGAGNFTISFPAGSLPGRSYLARITTNDGIYPEVTQDININIAQSIPTTILAKTISSPLPWYSTGNAPGAGYTVAIEVNAAENIGYIDSGDIVEFFIDVPVAGTYNFRANAAKGSGGTTIMTILEDNGGFTSIGSVNIPQSPTPNRWQNYFDQTTTVTFTNPGMQLIRLSFNGGANVKEIQFSTDNEAPVVVITSPADGIAIEEGIPINFVATADDEGTDISSDIVWNSDIDGDFGNGPNVNFAGLSVGTHLITASATDTGIPLPETGFDTITVIIGTAAPDCDVAFRVNAGGPAYISAAGDFEEDQSVANNGGSAQTGTPSPYIALGGAAVDKTFGATTPLVSNTTGYPDYLFQTERWSDADNPDNLNWTFPTGNGTFEVDILFNENWNNEINNPRVFDVFVEGELELDDYRPSGPAGLDVNIAKVERIRVTVSDGTLNINFLKGTQNPSVKGFSICEVTNTPPEVFITMPTDGATIDRNVTTTFEGNATDVEDDNTALTDAIIWSSLTAAEFAGTGGSFTDELITVGTHDLTASVTDIDGNEVSATVSVTVPGPDVDFTSPSNAEVFNTTEIQFTWTAANMLLFNPFDEHFHLYVNPADPNNLDPGDRISTAANIGQLFWDLGAADGIVPGANTVVIVAAEGIHTEFTNTEAKDIISFIVDTEAPIITCPADITASNDLGDCGADIVLTDPTATDNDSSVFTFDGIRDDGLLLSDPYPVGVTTITWTATDEANNVSDSCDQLITVTDNEAPDAVCTDITVQLDASGSASITAADVDGGSSDNCAVASIAIDIDSFDTSDVGSNTVTLTVTDDNGNFASCTATVTVEDNVAPDAVCQDITVELDAAGNANITAAEIDNGSSDAAGIASLAVSPSSFSCADLGANTVTLTVTDINGNTSSCFATVTVVDVTAPVIVCPADVFVSSPSGIPVVIEDIGTATATDICDGSPTISPSRSDGQAMNAAYPVNQPVTVTWTATDAAGNSSQCTQTVTVNFTASSDNDIETFTIAGQVGPTSINSGDHTVNLTVSFDTGLVGLSPTIVVSSFATVNPVSGAQTDFDGGPVIYNVTSQAGVTQPWTVTVNQEPDGTDPVVTCPADIVVSNDPGQCGAIVDFMASATDNSGNVTTTADMPPGSFFDIGLTVVTVTAEDAAGNTAQCTFNVTVNDTENPTIVCPADITESVPFGDTDKIVVYSLPNFDDNCAGSGIVQTAGLASGASFPVGTTTNTFVVTDAAGNTSSCSFDVTIDEDADAIPPEVTCPADIVVSNDPGQCGAIVSFMASATDNSGSVTTSADMPPGSFFDVGLTVVTVTAEDAAGNTAQCTFNITVNDTEAPVVVCPADTNIQGDENGEVALPDYTSSASATDNCPGVSVAQSPTAGTIISGTTTVTMTATDAEGLTSSCTFDVTVDETPTVLSVISFTLVNANNEQDIRPIMEGDIIDITTLPTTFLNIRANATDDTESVRLELSGAKTKGQTENFAPYALYGDSGGNYAGSNFIIGDYTILATPYSGNGQGGTEGTSLTVNFQITDQDPNCIGFNASIVAVSDPTTCGGNDGSATAQPQNGTPGFTYLWSNGNTNQTANNLDAGTHTVTVTDANGCSVVKSVSLSDPALPLVTLAALPSPIINTDAPITLDGSPAGGTYSGPGVSGSQFDPGVAGVGTHQISYSYTDPATGCSNSANRSVTVTTPTSNAALIVLDANTDTPLFALTDGLQIQQSAIPWGIVYNPNLNPNGIFFNLTGPISQSRGEGSSPPYSVFGDIGTNVLGQVFPVGDYRLVANPNVGATVIVNFSVIDGPPQNQPPIAVASGNADPVVAFKVNFSAAASIDNDGSIVEYSWDFGDGNTFVSATPTAMHTYGSAGVRTITLTVKDDDDATATTSIQVEAIDPDDVIKVISFTLVDAVTDNDLFLIDDGDNIDNGVGINIRANTDPGIVGSVKFVLTGAATRNWTESVAPYALYADNAGNYSEATLPNGAYTLTATPFESAGGSGVAGQPLTVNFTVGLFLPSMEPINSVLISPNPADRDANLVFDTPAQLQDILIYDVTGRLIKRVKASDNVDVGVYLIQVQDLPAGTYFVRARDVEGKEFQEQMAIKR